VIRRVLPIDRMAVLRSVRWLLTTVSKRACSSPDVRLLAVVDHCGGESTRP